MSTSLYRNMLSTAQQKMSASIEQIRQCIKHPGETGDLVEQVFRNQLQDLMPKKVGVANGFVMDSKGNISKQMDIILYDRLNTPRIFASEGAQIFPVESTYACGEIKTHMDVNQFKDSFEKCLSYKKLVREAYYPQCGPIQTKYLLFGDELDHWQSIFFCIATQSIDTAKLICTYKKFVGYTPSLLIHERIDTLVALDAEAKHKKRNMLLNGKVKEPESNIPQDKSIDLLPNHGSSICTYHAKEPWSLFIMLLLRYMVQVPTEPINMLFYGDENPY